MVVYVPHTNGAGTAFRTCPRCERTDVRVTKVRGDSTSYRCRFCGKRFRVAFDGS